MSYRCCVVMYVCAVSCIVYIFCLCCCLQGDDSFGGAVYADESSELPNGSVVRSIDVTIDIKKVAGRTLGFSIAGGRGSTPAYEDVDDVRGRGTWGRGSAYVCAVLCSIFCRVYT